MIAKRAAYFGMLLLYAGPLTGCGGWQSALNPQTQQARSLAHLFWFFTIVCTIVWLLVAAALIASLWRRRADSDEPREEAPAQQRRKTIVVSACVALTVAILAIFTLASFYATRGFAWPGKDALTIKITGQQWWWQVEYENADPTQIFTTANEIHIPAGRTVTFDLEASDVIHSFWVPNLMGKQDLIPGRKNSLTITADHPGLYRGQCAEFCGLQHAHMAFLVFVDTPEQFAAWRRTQLQSAAAPNGAAASKGLQVFLKSPCASCHTVAGTDAGGQFGPDLTHVAGRTTLAAGLLPNNRGNLTGWIANPQSLKPGSNMPAVSLSGADLTALVTYLETLK